MTSMTHVIVATGDWNQDNLRYRRHRLAEYLKAQPSTKEVIWVCPTYSKNENKLKRLQNGILQLEIRDSFPYRSTRFMRYYELFYKHKLPLLKEEITKITGEKNVLWFTFPGFSSISKIIKWDSIVYDCSDLWAAPISGRQSFISKFREDSIKQSEIKIISGSNIIFATSDYLKKNLQEKSEGIEPIVIENGVEFSHFQQIGEIPHVFKTITGPIIGYAGGLKPKNDFTVLLEIAKKKKNWNIVLVGPNSSADTVLEELLTLNNVYALGSINPSEVQDYMRQMDIGILPYKNSVYNEAVFPLKLYEYLAVGIPVIGWGVPSTQKYALDGVYHYYEGDIDSDKIIKDCEALLITQSEEIKEKRIALAETNDWDRKFEAMYKTIVNSF